MGKTKQKRPATVFEAAKMDCNGGGNIEFVPKPAKKPTRWGPGSDEKMLVMRRRLELGQHLHHVDDARRRHLG